MAMRGVNAMPGLQPREMARDGSFPAGVLTGPLVGSRVGATVHEGAW